MQLPMSYRYLIGLQSLHSRIGENPLQFQEEITF